MWVTKVLSEFLVLQIAQISCLNFRCAKRSNEPLSAEIVFSKGFHDFQSLISTAQKSFKQSYLRNLAGEEC